MSLHLSHVGKVVYIFEQCGQREVKVIVKWAQELQKNEKLISPTQTLENKTAGIDLWLRKGKLFPSCML